MNSGNFRSMQLLKEWPWHRKFGKSLIILAWLPLRSVSHVPYDVNFRSNNGPIMSSIFAYALRQFVILEAYSCSKHDRDTVNLVNYWYQLDCLLVRSVIFRMTPTSGLILGQICRQFLHAFSVNSGDNLRSYFAEVFCVICLRGV